MALTLAILTRLYRIMFIALFITLFPNLALAQTTKGEFNLAVSPTSASIALGSSANFSVSLTPVNGFNEPVNLIAESSSKQISINFSGNAVRPPATLSMQVNVADTVSPGNYTIGVVASSGPITKSQTISINVPTPTFNLSVSPTSIQTTPNSNLDFTVSVSGGSDLKRDVSLKAESKLPVSLASDSVKAPGTVRMVVNVPSGTAPGNYHVIVTGSLPGTTTSKTSTVNIDVRPLPDYTLSINPTSISLAATESADVFVNIASLNGFDGNVNLKVESELKASLSSNVINGAGTTRLSINTDRATPLKNYPITVTSTSETKGGVIEKRATLVVTVTEAPDFSLVVLPVNLDIDPGKSANVNVSITPTNRFTGIVNLTTNSSNPNITTSLTNSNIGPNSSASLTINVGTNVAPGNYDVSVFGSSTGIQQKTTIVRVNVKSVGDFGLVLNTNRQEIMAGESASFVVNTIGQMGFAERITLSASVDGLQTSFSPTTIDATATSTLTINTTKDTESKDYVITITARGGGITKTATATLTVKPALIGDFTLIATPDLQAISAGKSTSFSLAITPQNGFSDLVNLTAEVSEGSIQVVFSNRSARPGDNISATVITTANTPPQNYSIRIIGASGSLVKTALFGLNVTPQVQEAFSLALAPNLQSIANGESTMFTVGVVGRNSFNQAVSLSASTTDPTIQLNFDNATINAGGNTFITVTTSANTQPGSYTISITGRAGSLTVSQPVILAVRQAVLKVDISFEPPPTGQIAPPQNVKVLATELKPGQAQSIRTNANKVQPLVDGDLAGFKIYRLPTPAEGQPELTEQDLVKDENLIVTLPNDTTTFTDNVPVGASSTGNFTYSVTSFFGNGQSNGSKPAGTEIPVIKDPKFEKGTIVLVAASSFIKATGAILIINGIDQYPLILTPEATQFTVGKKIPSPLSGQTLKKLIKKGQTVELVVKNPDGKLSVAKSLTRPKKK
ncbi:MAG: hypothetical protein WAQ98_29120 [Blastocatellia bacterium]